MRLLHTFDDPSSGRRFFLLLEREGIRSKLETQEKSSWDSSSYGEQSSSLWIVEEDDFSVAKDKLDLFLKSDASSSSDHLHPKELQEAYRRLHPPFSFQPSPKASRTPWLTHILFFLLVAIFFLSPQPDTPQNLPSSVRNLPVGPAERALMFDYPKSYEILAKIREESLQPEPHPQEISLLWKEYSSTSYWKGIYPLILDHGRGKKSSPQKFPPMFEKIRQGEIYRAITPILLHNDLLHLFFNVLWLLLLTKQLELRIGILPLLTLIIVSAFFSNLAQYLMSGPNFIGFSGVLCAMIAMIHRRQQIAPWEGYQLDQNTKIFLLFSLGAFIFLQIIAFTLDFFDFPSFQLPIANTAHIVGALCGYCMARIPLFRKQL